MSFFSWLRRQEPFSEPYPLTVHASDWRYSLVLNCTALLSSTLSYLSLQLQLNAINSHESQSWGFRGFSWPKSRAGWARWVIAECTIYLVYSDILSSRRCFRFKKGKTNPYFNTKIPFVSWQGWNWSVQMKIPLRTLQHFLLWLLQQRVLPARAVNRAVGQTRAGKMRSKRQCSHEKGLCQPHRSGNFFLEELASFLCVFTSCS